MQKKEVSAIFLGDSPVGKTSIIYSIVDDGQVPPVTATISIGTFKKNNIVLYDTMGHKKFRILLPRHIQKSQICVLVFDLTDSDTLNSVKSLHSLVQEVGNKVKFLLVGNKSDKDDERTVNSTDAYKVAKELGIPEDCYFETSTLNRNGIQDLFNKIELIAETETFPDTDDSDNQNINNDDINQNKSRCF